MVKELLEVNNFEKVYGERKVVDKLCFKVKNGEIIVLSENDGSFIG